ncbi:hypothetical protein AMECASPLE_003432 [Ameca splendens]|uniref:Uncharacterized protein n=1 Tax=Ameca splendens TaxID=208324 RepID=A0ABV0ZUS9_9TELE
MSCFDQKNNRIPCQNCQELSPNRLMTNCPVELTSPNIMSCSKCSRFCSEQVKKLSPSTLFVHFVNGSIYIKVEMKVTSMAAVQVCHITQVKAAEIVFTNSGHKWKNKRDKNYHKYESIHTG